MTNSTGFDWDKYIEETPYNKVLDGLALARLTIPTMFSPCKNHVYLKSSDLSFKVTDFENLNRELDKKKIELKDCLSKLKTEASFDIIERLYILKIDLIVLSQLVSENPEEEIVLHPEAIFNEVQAA